LAVVVVRSYNLGTFVFREKVVGQKKVVVKGIVKIHLSKERRVLFSNQILSPV